MTDIKKIYTTKATSLISKKRTINEFLFNFKYKKNIKNLIFIMFFFFSWTSYSEDISCQKPDKNLDQKYVESLKPYFELPLYPNLRGDEVVLGKKNAEIKIVFYFDMECFYCKKGYKTLIELSQYYKDQMKIIFKHLPLSTHKHSHLAAQYFEAISIQDQKLAIKFSEELFLNQGKEKFNEEYFKKVTQEIGADLNSVLNIVHTDKIKRKVDIDIEEAQRLKFKGTPSFLVNGVPVIGARSKYTFMRIISELKGQGC